MVPGLGFEPRLTASKAAVLPLDDPGLNSFFQKYYTAIKTFILCEYLAYSNLKTLFSQDPKQPCCLGGKSQGCLFGGSCVS